MIVKNNLLTLPALSGFFHSFTGFASDREKTGDNSGNHTSRNFDKRNMRFTSFKNSGKIKKLIIGVFVAVLLFAGAKAISNSMGSGKNSTQKAEVKAAKATMDIYREFSFPLKDNSGETVAELKYILQQAELRDEIIVKGQRANSVKGREFLIVTLKISNDYSSPIEINTKDYIRLAVNGNENDWLAPDIHNDPVEIQAISTKYTRVGFAINETDKNLILRVGEIDGEKENIPLELKN